MELHLFFRSLKFWNVREFPLSLELGCVELGLACLLENEVGWHRRGFCIGTRKCLFAQIAHWDCGFGFSRRGEFGISFRCSDVKKLQDVQGGGYCKAWMEDQCRMGVVGRISQRWIRGLYSCVLVVELRDLDQWHWVDGEF